MTKDEIEGLDRLNKYMSDFLDKTDIPEEEKDHCIEMCPEYLEKVIGKLLIAEKYNNDEQLAALKGAVVGFIGGYAARHIYEFKRNVGN